MHRCVILLVDTFTKAKMVVQSMLNTSPHRTEDSLRRCVQGYLRGVMSERHSSRWKPAQERSAWRLRLSLLLAEARRQRHYLAAEEALRWAVSRPDLFKSLESSWVLDACLCCRSPNELQRLEDCVAESAGSEGGASTTRTEIATALIRQQRAALSARLKKVESRGLSSTVEAQSAPLDSPCDATSMVPTSAVKMDMTIPDSAALAFLHHSRDVAVTPPNEAFRRYFLHQNIVPNDHDLLQLTSSLRTPPKRHGFRVHLSSAFAAAVQEVLRGRPGLEPVSWLPASFGVYEMDRSAAVPFSQVLTNRRLLRHLAVEQLITSQNLSSMLAVHFLQPRPHENVLDVCASPGSKSALIHDVQHPYPHTADAGSGALIANDISEHRVAALLRRFEAHPHPSVGVTAYDASREEWTRDDGTTGALFEKILVDAPCSGESRLGREAHAWRLWHPRRGITFYMKQTALLRRTIQRCRVGGRVLYATCTFNPLENEAVVATIVRECGGAVRLIPLPAVHGAGPVLTPALRRWDVPSRDGGYYRTAEDAIACGDTEVPPSLFISESEEDRGIGAALHRCARRVLPHRNRDGMEGFFYALLEVVGKTPRTPSTHKLPETVVADTVLRSHNTPRLPVGCAVVERGNAAVAELLGPFIMRAGEGISPGWDVVAVDRFLDAHGLVPVLQRREGLALVSESLLAYIMPASYSSSDSPRSLGVVIATPEGRLTDAGASLLRPLLEPLQSPRLVSLPLSWFETLLHTKQLQIYIGPETCTSSREVEQIVRSIYKLHSGLAEQRAETLPRRALSPLLASLAKHHRKGNAVATLAAQSSMNGSAALPFRGRGRDSVLSPLQQSAAASWALPVEVEADADPPTATGNTTSLTVRLCCSSATRNRCRALLGRLRRRRDAADHKVRPSRAAVPSLPSAPVGQAVPPLRSHFHEMKETPTETETVSSTHFF